MELDVNEWITNFTRVEAADDTKESSLYGDNSSIQKLTGSEKIKADNFELFRYTKKRSPTLIGADKYYDYYNTQVVRFDVSFLSSVSEVSGKEVLHYTSLNSLDNEYGSITGDDTLSVNNQINNNSNNNFFVGATIEDFGSYKTLNLTLKDRTFTTLSGYIYQAIELGNGNVKAFGNHTEDPETKDENLINTELTNTTTLKFLKTPTTSKIKNNLKIRYGYQTTTSEGKNNFPRADFGSEWKDQYADEMTHRWITATQWEGSANLRSTEVSPTKVLSLRHYQTTKVLPEMDFFITDISTNLTPTGITYNIKASSTENFALNNIKFLQQYTVLRGKPKSLLASLMKVFNSTEETPIKLVWCDKEFNKNYLNGSEILKNYKTGEFEIMYEDTVKDTIEDDRKTLNDLNKQIEVLSNLRDLFTESSTLKVEGNGNNLGYDYLKKEVMKNIKSGAVSVSNEIKKHKFENVLFYPVRNISSGETGVINDISDSKNVTYILDVCKNYKFYGTEESFGSDVVTTVRSGRIFGTWINFIKSKVSTVSNQDGEKQRQKAVYEEYLAREKKMQAKEKLSNAASKVEKIWSDLNSQIPIESSLTPGTTEQNYETLSAGGLLISLKPKDEIHICEKIFYKSGGSGTMEYKIPVYIDSNDFDHGIFKNSISDSLYDSYKSTFEDKDLDIVETFNTIYEKIYKDNSIWNDLSSADKEKVLLGNESTIYNNLSANTSLVNIIDSYNSASPAATYVDLYSKYRIGILSFLGSNNIKNDSTEGVGLTSGTKNIFKTILSSDNANQGLLNKEYTSASYYELANTKGDFKIKGQASKFVDEFDGILSDIQKAKFFLNEARAKQPLIIKTSPDGFNNFSETQIKIEKIKISDSETINDGNYSIVNSSGSLTSTFKKLLKAILSGESSSEINNKINSIEKVLKAMNGFLLIGGYSESPLTSLVLLAEQVYLAVKKYRNNVSTTWENVKTAKKKLAEAVFNYVVKDSEFKDALTRYYIAALDYYYKSKKSSADAAARSYSWKTLAIDAAKDLNDSTINNGAIKKNGEGDSLTFSEMAFGSSIDGSKNYFIESMKFAKGEMINEEGSSIEDKMIEFAEELDDQIKQFLEIKDLIDAEYAKANETKIGKEITLSLGSEDSQYKNDRYTKSLSSLFNDFCSQCMPMIKATDMIATSTKDEEGNSTTATVTDEAAKQSLTWSVVGKYKNNDGTTVPIIGFYYKEPKIPSYIREYAWGTGNSKMHCIKDINISTASEFAMYSTVSTMKIENGKLDSATNIDYSNDRRSEVIRISTPSGSVPSETAFFPNLVANGEKQKNLMNNLLQAINKGTLTLLGDPSLVFTGEIQPYTYPIFLNIKLQQEGVSWSGGNKGGMSANVQSYLSGIYVVGKITHTFSNSGYLTTLEVIRYPGLDKDYKSAISFD